MLIVSAKIIFKISKTIELLIIATDWALLQSLVNCNDFQKSRDRFSNRPIFLYITLCNFFLPGNNVKSKDLDEIIQSLMAALERLQSYWQVYILQCSLTVRWFKLSNKDRKQSENITWSLFCINHSFMGPVFHSWVFTMCNLNMFSNPFMISLAYTSYFKRFPKNKENSGNHTNTHTKIISKTMIEIT